MANELTPVLAKVLARELAERAKEEKIEVGLHYLGERVTLEVTGTAEQKEEQLHTPTVSVPIVETLALFASKLPPNEKILTEALGAALAEAMDGGKPPDQFLDLTQRMIAEVREKLLAKLPKKTRTGTFKPQVTLRIVSVGPASRKARCA